MKFSLATLGAILLACNTASATSGPYKASVQQRNVDQGLQQREASLEHSKAGLFVRDEDEEDEDDDEEDEDEDEDDDEEGRKSSLYIF